MAKLSPSSALLIFVIPVLAAVLFYRLETFEPAQLPEHELTQKGPPFSVPKSNSHMLRGSEKLGYGELPAPEDVAYDRKTGVIYTGCEDGWIRRLTLASDTAVEKWVNTGGRPLAIAHGLHGDVIVADAFKGLLNISKDGVVELLSDEAEGLKFKLTDAVDVGGDGMIYFTDASYKYHVNESILDMLECRPQGRLLSYDPSTKQTRVLIKDLYFANGVAVSADQTFVIVCETPMRRCKKYYVQGSKKGSVEIFIENLPGLPDNIRYDGEGLYWIALFTDPHSFKVLQRYPFIRKVVAMLEKYAKRPKFEKNGGAVGVDLDGKPTVHYYDRDASEITSSIKIGDYLYMGSISQSYILRLNLSRYPAITPTA